MSGHPTSNRSQGIPNLPASKEVVTDDNDKKVTGLPHQKDEEIVESKNKSEDFEKFNIDKVDDLNKAKTENQDNK